MEKFSDRATLDYKDGLITVRIDCPGISNAKSEIIRSSLTVYFMEKLLGLLAEKGFMERNDAEDALFMFEDYLQNKGNEMNIDSVLGLFDLEDENGYF